MSQEKNKGGRPKSLKKNTKKITSIPKQGFKNPINIKEIVEKYKSLSIDQLKKQVKPQPKNRGYNMPMEQIVIILKILQLNGLNYSQTLEDCNNVITRSGLVYWVKKYGPQVLSTTPVEDIAQRIETDIAVIKNEVQTEAYLLIKNNLKRMNAICQDVTGVRGIYALAEAIRATAEVIKMEKELSDLGKPKGSDFFMNIHNMMVNNTYGIDGNKG